ncbi:YbfB/YjiJ family MFS transporter, partial [Sedimentitalea nanhaiensis]|uniref:Predicted arabinose efflux permease, MFS family n=1 Tax=Sedimentitalea nanhaiensis TaxID=999627 RepID=A0A1I7BR77_9RHOB
MSRDPTRPWLVLFGLALGMCVTNSFARFAYGLMLPAMKTEMGWNYTQAGWLNTANAIGYILGAALTMGLIGRVGATRLFSFGMVTTAASLMATGLQEALWWQTLWRVAAGLFGAMSFSSSGALAAQLFQHDARRNALAIGLLFGFGGGLGILLAGAVIPLMLDRFGNGAWPQGWILIGLTSFAFVPLSLWAAAQLSGPRQQGPRPIRLPLRPILAQMVGYGTFGLGYFVYFTFLSVWMTERQFGAGMIATVWVLLGLCLCVSPFVWRPVFARFNSGAPLAMILTCIATGTALPVLWPGPVGLLLSAMAFGLSVFMSPSAVTSFIRHNLPMQNWGAAISLFTLVFAVAQTIGPYAAGWLGDLTTDLGISLLAASGVLLSGALVALQQKPLPQN